MEINEIRRISIYMVRDACIRYNLYTCGNCEDYKSMLIYVDSIYNATASQLKRIATDIKEHSDTERDILNIMFILANECCTSIFKDTKSVV